ncbi:MAG: hypothetical protein Q9216_000315 [Gyalolechia sp. 2 TL-2023]
MASAPSSVKRWYDGNCHCAAIKFKVLLASLEDYEVKTCNCSICSRNGYMLVYPPREDLVYLRGEDSIKGYYFNDKQAEHRFCGNCGSSISVDPHGNFGDQDFVAVNVRMLQGIELDRLKITAVDGKKLIPTPYNPK